MKRLLLPTITLAVCLAIAHAGPVASTWEDFKAAVAAGDSVHSQAVNMGDGTYTVINRSLGVVCDGDCLAADGSTAPGDVAIVTDGARLWMAGVLGPCSNICGTGEASREVTCVNAEGEPTTGCDEDFKPDTTSACSDTSGCTYAWAQSGFGSCSTQCGSGTQNQTVSCVRSDGETVANGFCSAQAPPASQACASTEHCPSCKAIKNANDAAGSGVYTIFPNGNQLDAYCDMTHAGGGWTMVVAQFEAHPVAWSGNMANYDPTLANGYGWALTENLLPTDRTQTAFGKDLYATYVGYATWAYTTGNIAKRSAVNLLTGASFHIHRSTGGYYSWMDPEEAWNANCASPGRCNTLTFDRSGGTGFNWAFAARGQEATQKYCGYGMAGASLSASYESYAWTVWVR